MKLCLLVNATILHVCSPGAIANYWIVLIPQTEIPNTVRRSTLLSDIGHEYKLALLCEAGESVQDGRVWAISRLTFILVFE